MEEDAMVEELVDVVVVDVRIVAEDLMALKMRLLVVDAVVRLIEEGMDMDVGVVELATLIGSGLLMLLKMVTTTTNSLLFWTIHIKTAQKHHTFLVGGRSCADYQKAELATSNWQMTCKPSLEINKKSYTTAFHHHRRGWSGTGSSLPRHGNFKLNFKLNHSPAPSKPAHHHQDCWKGCTVWKKSFQHNPATFSIRHMVGQPRSVFTFICLCHIINSFFHRCPPTSSVHWRVWGLTSLFGETKAAHH